MKIKTNPKIILKNVCSISSSSGSKMTTIYISPIRYLPGNNAILGYYIQTVNLPNFYIVTFSYL